MSAFLHKNIRVFRAALDDHNARCPVAARAFLLNPADFEALGQTSLWGLDIRPDPRVRPSRLRVLCDGSAWLIEDELEKHLQSVIAL